MTKEQAPFNGQGNGTNAALGNGKKQPNILYIMADQMSAPQLKMYNPDSQIKTPNLDALAARSVQFDSAYCPSPLCAPSRMSMISGQFPMKIGAYDNASQIGSDVLTYAHYLRLRNYHTVLAGKMHFVGDQLHGYETRLTSDIYPGDFGWAVDWDNPETRLEWYHNASSIKQAGTCVRSNQLDYDEEVMYKSTQFLYDQVRKSDDRPFCLTVRLIRKNNKIWMAGHPAIVTCRRFWINVPNVLLTVSARLCRFLSPTLMTLTPLRRSTGSGMRESTSTFPRSGSPRRNWTPTARGC